MPAIISDIHWIDSEREKTIFIIRNGEGADTGSDLPCLGAQAEHCNRHPQHLVSHRTPIQAAYRLGFGGRDYWVATASLKISSLILIQ